MIDLQIGLGKEDGYERFRYDFSEVVKKIPVDLAVILWNHHKWILENGIKRITFAVVLWASFMPIILLSH